MKQKTDIDLRYCHFCGVYHLNNSNFYYKSSRTCKQNLAFNNYLNRRRAAKKPVENKLFQHIYSKEEVESYRNRIESNRLNIKELAIELRTTMKAAKLIITDAGRRPINLKKTSKVPSIISDKGETNEQRSIRRRKAESQKRLLALSCLSTELMRNI